jgi:hypothetical protein
MDQGAPPRELTEAERRAVEYGIDLSLIDENLRLTPLERIRQHDAAVGEILELQRIREERAAYGSAP